MNSSFISEARVSPTMPASLAFERVSLRFRPHWVGWQFRQIALEALTGRTRPRGEDIWLYRDLSFRIGHGERVGIIGGNGAGKSTLLKLMLGVYRATTGQVSVRGRVSALLELGAGFNVELSAPENIQLTGAFLGFGPRDMSGKTERILEFAGLTDSRDLPVKYYSSGMLLRLAFSIATDIDPEILLLDEIFAVGDAEFSQRAMQRMRQLLDASHIAVIVSHNLALVQTFCTRAVWLHAGTIQQDADPPTVCAAYKAFADQASARANT
jgi:ABC-type polysaccharide/polyol phosphate transport system ATPase subunit